MGESEVKGTWRLAAKHGLILLGGGLVVFACMDTGGSGPLRMTPKEATRGVAMQLVNAVKQFHAEYGRFPAGLDARTPATSERALFAQLTGLDPATNPRGISYLPELREVRGRAPGPGARQDATGPSVVDAWGQPYFVLADADHEGRVADPAKPGAFLGQTVVIFSAGPDKDASTWEDNVTTWASPK